MRMDNGFCTWAVGTIIFVRHFPKLDQIGSKIVGMPSTLIGNTTSARVTGMPQLITARTGMRLRR